MQDFYSLLEIDRSATVDQISTAIDEQYDKWRRLTSHHDAQLQNQANQALFQIEQARNTLLDLTKKGPYDVELGAGGIADPDAIHQHSGLHSPLTPLRSPISSTALERTDAWVCNSCKKANPIGSIHCQQCGRSVGQICVKCDTTSPATAKFCLSCGVNLAELKTQIEQDAIDREIYWQQQQKLRAEQEVRLAPMRETAESAQKWQRIGCATSIFFGIFGLPFVIYSLRRSKAVLDSQHQPGDESIREMAKTARTWSIVAAVLIVSMTAFTFAVFVLPLLMVLIGAGLEGL